MYFRNTAGQGMGFGLVNASTGAALTGATVTPSVVKDGGAQGAGLGTVTELGNGQYWYALGTLDTNAANVSVMFTAPSAVPVEKSFVTTVVYQMNTTGQGIGFALVSTATGAAVLGAVVTARLSANGGAQGAVGGTVTEKGGGQYWLALSKGDTNLNTGSLLFTAAGAVLVEKTFITTGAIPGFPLGADAETANAFINLWGSTPAIVGLVPGGIHKDRLFPPPARPYARIQVKQGPKPNSYSTGGRYIDYREVTITIWGIGDVNIGAIIPALITAFDGSPALVFPNSPASLIRCEPLGITVAQEKDVKSGEDYRAATCRWCVWTDRVAA